MKFDFKNPVWAFVLLIVLFSCEDSGNEKPLGAYESGVLILNEGAFGANDGEVFHFDPKTGEVVENVFELENARPFAGLLEDLVVDDERLYLVANTGKVEVVNAGDFKSRGAVVGDLDQPRSLAVVNGKLFISDYGPYDADYNTPDSYVAVVLGLDGGTVKKKIPVSNKPEDLFVSGKYVLVAGSEEGKLEVIDVEKEELSKTLNVAGDPVQFFEFNGGLWLYATSSEKVFFHRISPGSFSIAETREFAVSNATPKLALSPSGTVYLITSSGWPEYRDAIASVPFSGSGQLNKEFITGSGFYGIGFGENQIFLANSKGFQGNGEVVIYDQVGNQVKTLEVGRGPSGFVF